jgi:predicted DNA-binding transcriptional regulator AlpA
MYFDAWLCLKNEQVNSMGQSDSTPNRLARRAAKRGFTEAEAAKYIAMSRSFLRQVRMNGDRVGRTPGPPWIRIGSRAVRYLRDDLDAWLERHRQRH